MKNGDSGEIFLQFTTKSANITSFLKLRIFPEIFENWQQIRSCIASSVFRGGLGQVVVHLQVTKNEKYIINDRYTVSIFHDYSYVDIN